MIENCLSCRHGSYWREKKVICFVHDDLVMETDSCGLWREKDE